MNCPTCREAVSARLDGEDRPAERAATDAHLAGCASCRAWADDAAAVTRLIRLGLPTPPSPGVSDRVLTAAPGRRWAVTARALRWLLGGLGAAQLVLGLVQIAELARRTHPDGGQMASPGHLWHESAAWNLALGAGFAWVAARRARPSAIAPMLTVFLAVLVPLSLDDLIAGRVEFGWLLSHGFVVAGYVILVVLTRPAFDLGDPPAHRRRPGRRRWLPPGGRQDATGPPLPPTGRSMPAAGGSRTDRSTPAARSREVA